MEPKKYLIPKENASDQSVKVIEINVQSGEFIKADELIFVYETSKATFEVFTEYDSIIYHNITQNSNIDVGEVLFTYCFNLTDYEKLEEANINSHDSILYEKLTSKAKEFVLKNKLDESLLKRDFNNKSLITLKDLENKYSLKKSYTKGSRVFTDNDLVIFGAGGHALQCLEVIEEKKEFNLIGFVAKESISELSNLVIGHDFDDIIKMRNDGLKNVIIGIGMLKNLNKRKLLYNELKANELNVPNLISKNTYISNYSKITKNIGVQIFQGVFIGPSVQIKENVVINSNATISHHCKLKHSCNISPGAILAGGVTIGEKSLIGMGSTIYLNIEIPENSTINNLSNIF